MQLQYLLAFLQEELLSVPVQQYGVELTGHFVKAPIMGAQYLTMCFAVFVAIRVRLAVRLRCNSCESLQLGAVHDS